MFEILEDKRRHECFGVETEPSKIALQGMVNRGVLETDGQLSTTTA